MPLFQKWIRNQKTNPALILFVKKLLKKAVLLTRVTFSERF